MIVCFGVSRFALSGWLCLCTFVRVCIHVVLFVLFWFLAFSLCLLACLLDCLRWGFSICSARLTMSVYACPCVYLFCVVCIVVFIGFACLVAWLFCLGFPELFCQFGYVSLGSFECLFILRCLSCVVCRGFVCLFACLSVCVLIWFVGWFVVCMPVGQFGCLLVCVVACLFVCLCCWLFVCVLVCWVVCMFACLLICLFVGVHVCLFSCLRVCLLDCVVVRSFAYCSLFVWAFICLLMYYVLVV